MELEAESRSCTWEPKAGPELELRVGAGSWKLEPAAGPGGWSRELEQQLGSGAGTGSRSQELEAGAGSWSRSWEAVLY